MNFNDFPEPYNRELPRRIEEAREQLASPEGLSVLERIVALHQGQIPRGEEQAHLIADVEALDPHDSGIVVRIIGLFKKALEAQREEEAKRDPFNLLLDVFDRAREVDPDFAARGDNVTLEEAVEVLERHGQPAEVPDQE